MSLRSVLLVWTSERPQRVGDVLLGQRDQRPAGGIIADAAGAAAEEGNEIGGPLEGGAAPDAEEVSSSICPRATRSR